MFADRVTGRVTKRYRERKLQLGLGKPTGKGQRRLIGRRLAGQTEEPQAKLSFRVNLVSEEPQGS